MQYHWYLLCVKRMINYPLNVTIDTNIFEENKFDFGPDGTMNLLIKNVQNGKIKLVLSNIVIKEVFVNVLMMYAERQEN